MTNSRITIEHPLFPSFSQGLSEYKSTIPHEFTDEDFVYYVFDFINANFALSFKDMRELICLNYPEIEQRLPFLLRKYQAKLEIVPQHENYLYIFTNKAEAEFYITLLHLLGVTGLDMENLFFEPISIKETGDAVCPFGFVLNKNQYTNEQNLLYPDTLVKNIRSDANNFFQECIKGLIQLTPEDRNQHLRVGKHKAFAVFYQGYFKYEERDKRFGSAEELQKFKDMKKGHSKQQSTSLYIRGISDQLFIHQNNMLKDSVILTFNPQEYAYNRISAKILGSVFRPLEADTEKEAQQKFEQYKSMLFKDVKSIREFLIKEFPNTTYVSELLPYLTFSLNTSGIAIVENNFESRCRAQHIARTVYRLEKKKYELLGKLLPPNFTIPISILPDWRAVSPKQRKQDRADAIRIFQSDRLLEQYLTDKKPYFLWLLDKKYCNELLNTKFKGINILFYLVCNGFFEIAESVYNNTDLSEQKKLGDYLNENKNNKEIEFIKTHTVSLDAHSLIPVFAAIQRDQKELCEILEYQLDWQDCEGYTAFTTAIRFEKTWFVEKILREHPDPFLLMSMVNRQSEDAIILAVKTGNEVIVKLLLNQLFIENKPAKTSNLLSRKIPHSAFSLSTLLHALIFANHANHQDIIKEFLFFACTTNDINLLHHLIKNCKNFNIRHQLQDGNHILSAAIYKYRPDIIEELLRCEAGIDLLIANSDILISIAASLESTKIVTMLTEAKSQVEKWGKEAYLQSKPKKDYPRLEQYLQHFKNVRVNQQQIPTQKIQQTPTPFSLPPSSAFSTIYQNRAIPMTHQPVTYNINQPSLNYGNSGMLPYLNQADSHTLISLCNQLAFLANRAQTYQSYDDFQKLIKINADIEKLMFPVLFRQPEIISYLYQNIAQLVKYSTEGITKDNIAQFYITLTQISLISKLYSESKIFSSQQASTVNTQTIPVVTPQIYLNQPGFMPSRLQQPQPQQPQQQPPLQSQLKPQPSLNLTPMSFFPPSSLQSKSPLPIPSMPIPNTFNQVNLTTNPLPPSSTQLAGLSLNSNSLFGSLPNKIILLDEDKNIKTTANKKKRKKMSDDEDSSHDHDDSEDTTYPEKKQKR